MAEVLRRDGVLPNRGAADRAADGPAVPGAKDGLRQPRQLEEEHVPAARELTAVRPQVLREDRRVRTVEHDEPPRRLRVVHREGPRDGTPPVVSDDRRFPLAEGLDQPAHVGDQLGQRVGRDPLGLVALVVAAQVRRDDAKTWRERRDLVTPRIPALRKAVQEDDERPVAVDGTVQPDAVRLDEPVLHRHPARIARGRRACQIIDPRLRLGSAGRRE